MHCTALYCIYYIVLHHNALYWVIQYYPVLYSIVLHCTTFYWSKKYFPVFTALCCILLHCTALYCIVLYCTAFYCTLLYSQSSRQPSRRPWICWAQPLLAPPVRRKAHQLLQSAGRHTSSSNQGGVTPAPPVRRESHQLLQSGGSHPSFHWGDLTLVYFVLYRWSLYL